MLTRRPCWKGTAAGWMVGSQLGGERHLGVRRASVGSEIVIGWRKAWTAHEREADWMTGRADSGTAAEQPMGALLLLNSVRPGLALSYVR